MTAILRLKPITSDEIEDVLAHALRFKGRKRVDPAGPLIAQIAADHLRQALDDAGFVLMRRPDRAAPSTTRHHKI
jgi:hypothetical protein